MASLIQAENEDIPTVSNITDGFYVVPTRYGPSFRYNDCDVEVDP
jgi:hypothetical protein